VQDTLGTLGKIPYSVVIGGIGKDISSTQVKSIVPKMKRLGMTFQKYHVLIYENNSSNESRQAWREALAELGEYATLVSEDIEINTDNDKRTGNIARARNGFLSTIRDNSTLSDFDYVIITDLDRTCGGLDSTISYNMTVFQNAFELQADWDVLSFRVSPYWDRWAFRHPTLMPYNMWSKRRLWRMKNTIQTKIDMEYYVSKLDPNTLFEVESAYMMLSIYKLKATKDCNYGSRDSMGGQECEHVVFHKEMREKNGAKIRILPQHLCEMPTRTTDLSLSLSQVLESTIQRDPLIPIQCLVPPGGPISDECLHFK
jgi:hypothetical protein